MDDAAVRRQLLAALTEDARQGPEDLARQLGIGEDRAAAALSALEEDGVVRGYQAVVDWDETDAPYVTAEVELNVELDRETSYEDVARRVVKFSEVESLRLVSGDFDFAATVSGESMNDISHFIAERIATIPEVTQTVTHFVMETYKDRGVEFEGTDEDDRLSVSP
ncbi:MAG: transcriptional regulator, AsnC family [uncultured archaeon A07HB70]|nr:MAG: transcriptional regulator, AsnC family [uncultured archaeon A07HB70]